LSMMVKVSLGMLVSLGVDCELQLLRR